MSNLRRFEKYRGRVIQVEGSDNHYFVPMKDDEDEIFEECVEEMGFEEKMDEGWNVVAIDGYVNEDGELEQSVGLLAVKGDELLVCEAGDNRILRTSAAAAEIEIVVDEEEEEDDE